MSTESGSAASPEATQSSQRKHLTGNEGERGNLGIPASNSTVDDDETLDHIIKRLGDHGTPEANEFEVLYSQLMRVIKSATMTRKEPKDMMCLPRTSGQAKPMIDSKSRHSPRRFEYSERNAEAWGMIDWVVDTIGDLRSLHLELTRQSSRFNLPKTGLQSLADSIAKIEEYLEELAFKLEKDLDAEFNKVKFSMLLQLGKCEDRHEKSRKATKE